MQQHSKTLHLVLKKKWFDMILSGEKKEEYREMKRFWIQRLCNEIEYELPEPTWSKVYKTFDTVTFQLGYAKNAPRFTIECKGINIGPAKPEWSDNWPGDCFRIKLGKIITTHGC